LNRKAFEDDAAKEEGSDASDMFSREHKILNQCKAIREKADGFLKSINNVESLASDLSGANKNNSGEYEDCASKIATAQTAAEQFLKDINILVETQVLLVKQLDSTTTGRDDRDPIQNPGPSAVPVDDNDTDGASAPVDPVQLSEFSAGLAEVEEGVTAPTGDQVFLRIADEENNCETATNTTDGNDKDKDKALTQMFSGVMEQLRTTLGPVKEKMDKREEEAVKRAYGNVESQLDPTDPRAGVTTVAEGAEATVTQGVEATVTQGVEATVTQGVEATVTQGVEATVNQGVEATVTQGVEATITQGVEATVTQGVEATVTQGVEATVTQGVEATVTQGAEATVTEGAEAAVTQGAEATEVTVGAGGTGASETETETW